MLSLASQPRGAYGSLTSLCLALQQLVTNPACSNMTELLHACEGVRDSDSLVMLMRAITAEQLLRKPKSFFAEMLKQYDAHEEK